MLGRFSFLRRRERPLLAGKVDSNVILREGVKTKTH